MDFILSNAERIFEAGFVILLITASVYEQIYVKKLAIKNVPGK